MPEEGDISIIPVYLDHQDWTIRWSINKGTARAGDEAGSEVGRGYRQIKHKGKRHLTHRVVFFIFNGFLPEVVDHIDGNTRNNNPENLRAASKSQNMINRKIQKNNNSGVPGVDFMIRRNVWRAQIHNGGKKIFLGTFKNKEDAIKARLTAQVELHGEYSRGHSNSDALLKQLETGE